MSEHGLPSPVRELLDVEPEDADVPRMWREVEVRRARRRSRALWAGPALAAAAVLLAGAWVLTTGWREAPAPGASLSVVDGSAFAGVQPAGRTISLDDGSWIRTEPETELAVLQNDGRDVVLHLRDGAIEVEVRPGGPRRWVIEAGRTRVEVVGTHFEVSRRGPAVDVSVSRGEVIVRHPDLDDGLQSLPAGRSVQVGRRAELQTSTPARSASVPSLPAGQDVAPPPIDATGPSPGPAPAPASDPAHADRLGTGPRSSWRRAATAGDYERALSELGPSGMASARRGATAGDLLLLADVARYSGHPELALAPLRQLLRVHREHPSAPLAAFVLAQIELDQLGRPRAAAQHLEQALTLGLRGPLAADARARLARARRRSGDHAGARAAACSYLSEQPDGPHASTMRELCEP